MSWLGGILKDPEKRAVLSWLGGGAVVVAGGIWAVVTFVVEHKDTPDKNGGTTVTLSGEGVASGHDINIGGNVNIGFDEKRAQKNFDELKDKIDSLTVQLNALRQTPAAPGAQQALGAAVGSITQGAEQGDARLKQALVLLKDNKVAEATQLLNTVAKDKTAQAEQAATHAETDRKEAAIAYRNLGAIAGLRDPKAAREAYAKAVALDPDNAEGLAWDGEFQLHARNLAAAEKSYRALLRLAGKGANEHQIFWARAGLGDIAAAHGDLNAALKAYGEARPMDERFAGSGAGNTEWQGDLSVSNGKIGDVLVKQGNLPEALKSYRASLAIAERLAGSDAGNAQWQRDLSVTYERIGDVLVKQGKLAGAESSYRAELAIAERLAGSDAGNAVWQGDLSVSNSKIGDVLVKQGKLAGAESSYRAGLAIAERLAGSDAGNAQWQRDLSVSHEKIGNVLVLQGKLAEAEAAYRAGLVIAERLAGSDAGNAEWQRDLSVLNNNIGDVLVKQGNLPEAEKSYRAGLAIRERLAGSDAGNAEWQRDLSVSYNKIGDVLVSQGNLAEALKSYRAGLAIAEHLAGSDAGNAEWQRDLIISYKKIADCAPKERRANLTHALDIARALDASDRLAPADKWMLNVLARLIAEVPEKQGRARSGH
jgi:tetratricopeptide (TPR) repeat protein